MYDHLQARYPGSGWLSEFLGCENGLFIVRAVLSLEGEPQATALAAAATVEAAEDQARDRLLALLNLSPAAPAKARPHRPRDLPESTAPEASPAPVLPATAPPAIAPASEPQIADVDEFVRINAETQRHLKRLGWDGDRLRQYLQTTYGRSSRQQLRDVELLEFLNYLKTQDP